MEGMLYFGPNAGFQAFPFDVQRFEFIFCHRFLLAPLHRDMPGHQLVLSFFPLFQASPQKGDCLHPLQYLCSPNP